MTTRSSRRVFRDDRGRELVFATPPKRIVSLVPSDTFTLAALAGEERAIEIVGRTRYCEEPPAIVKTIPIVGGTKDIDVDAIVALAPDLVLCNQEENEKRSIERLAQRGVPIFVVFPKRVADGIALIARYASMLGLASKPHVRALLSDGYRMIRRLESLRAETPPMSTFCPIWADPLMTIHGATYMSDALDLAGAQNIFADRERRYPLAADLGTASPLPAARTVGRDVRYPRIATDELRARAPELVLLPDEPHPFSDEDADRFRALNLPASVVRTDGRDRVVRLPGKDLAWYGAWAIEGLPRLRDTIESFR